MVGNTLVRETREELGTCPSTPKPTCTQVIGSGGSCTRLSKFLIGAYSNAERMIHNALIFLMTLKLFEWILLRTWKGFSDFTHCYFYNSLERKWLERSWFGKYGISWHISVLLRKSESRLQWQGFIYVIQSCIVKTKSAIAIMQNVFCSIKA